MTADYVAVSSICFVCGTTAPGMEPEGWAVWERTSTPLPYFLHSCPEHSEHEGLWDGLRDNQDTVWVKTSRPASLAEGGEQNFHSLRVSVENDWLHTKFICTAPEGTLCRMRCTDEDCEYWDDDGTHSLVDSGHCNAKEWFDAVDWLECHESTGHESLLYEGPVDAFWDGEDFQWRIVPAPSRAEPELTKEKMKTNFYDKFPANDMAKGIRQDESSWRLDAFLDEIFGHSVAEGGEQKALEWRALGTTFAELVHWATLHALDELEGYARDSAEIRAFYERNQ